MIQATKSGSPSRIRRTIALYAALPLMMLAGADSIGAQSGFTLTSPQLKQGGMVTMEQWGRSCEGREISPELNWTSGPEGTGSYVVAVYQARKGGYTGHQVVWLVYNIPSSVHSLAKGAGTEELGLLPAAASQARLFTRRNDYLGPCLEPETIGRFEFAVYAMRSPKLDVGDRDAREILKELIEPDKLGVAIIRTEFRR